MSKAPRPNALTLMRQRADAARNPTTREKAAWNNFYAAASPKKVAIPDIPKERAKPVRRALPGESEAEILKAIMSLLKRHPKVAKVWRQNSMVAQFAGANGKTRFVRANTARGMSDIQGILKTGRGFFIEVKTEIGRVEEHQMQFLYDMRDAGALAFVARNVDIVIAMLKDA